MSRDRDIIKPIPKLIIFIFYAACETNHVGKTSSVKHVSNVCCGQLSSEEREKLVASLKSVKLGRDSGGDKVLFSMPSL